MNPDTTVAEPLEATPGLTDDDARIAASIRSHRLRRNLTLAQLGELSGISVAHLSRLENGSRTPTVRLMLQLARALGVSLGALVGESSEPSTVYVSRAAERYTLAAGDTSVQSLSDPALRRLQAVELCLAPGRIGEPASHSGEEWVYVLSGAIEVDLNGSTSALDAGDAVHFRADIRHALCNPHAEAATVLVVNALEAPALNLGH
ncbi:MAG: XRE family transcriptional regulator [Solirubrobacterales bacterium]|nr:XRE family transcriptional regulator [Solirubrobacterales bacterium]